MTVALGGYGSITPKKENEKPLRSLNSLRKQGLGRIFP